MVTAAMSTPVEVPYVKRSRVKLTGIDALGGIWRDRPWSMSERNLIAEIQQPAETRQWNFYVTGSDPATHLAAHHQSTYIFLADRHGGWWLAPLRWVLRASLALRSHLMVRGSRRRRSEKPAEGRH